MPDHLIILGGSYVALEFAQMFRHFGCKVTVLERAPQLLKKEDADVVEALGGGLREEGIEVQLNCAVKRVEKENGLKAERSKFSPRTPRGLAT